MPLQDNTEDFRADMDRFKQVFTTPEADLSRARRRNQWLLYTIAILVVALATALFWIGTRVLE